MNSSNKRLKAFLVDDEWLALERLTRLLETRRVEILGSATDPEDAVLQIIEMRPEAIFLDVQMPTLNGFELLARLTYEPIVILTTAFDQYALRAFQVNSIDYLLKTIEAEQLDRASLKIENFHETTDVWMDDSRRSNDWLRRSKIIAGVIRGGFLSE